MIRVVRLLFAAIILFSIPANATPPELNVDDGSMFKATKFESGHEFEGKLEDGKRVKVRIVGLDCPEGKLGKDAKAAVQRLLKGKRVTLESTFPMFPLAQDNYGRLVAYVRLDDGRDLSAALLESGHCSAQTWSTPHPRQNLYAGIR